ncbi:hypothetical protein KHM19_31360 [Leptospira borgpetersenii]|uniref:PF11042 domain protein n=4 Tax=Leptospira borgpetersenii TaxID=174 RepID=M3GZ40_LEPBO|nr:PF11042 domain protein [Leptospira borgpetersenii str. 200801926]EKQ91084.1 PF11042 domain protein [Leptospira borgpetersenii str. UI 09149]EMG00099.1 PF11042 domain protein [Leptospira borgpetersenii str. 200701203]EMN14970.1 PF11042 domain protein [Leptospira borgpetersenii str. Brem 307]EMN17727.1 PF11042 domain protein [Leptospira borgpetersenii str. Brem 328]EMN59552.1 PF11042 domain protein [Leptospira borgpetersenii serovar Javanica str. MK146]ENO65566.1 PF11042 domain protein [Lept
MPFWSSLNRVQTVIDHVDAYSLFKTYEISFQNFMDRWLPGLKNDNLLVGIIGPDPKRPGMIITLPTNTWI